MADDQKVTKTKYSFPAHAVGYTPGDVEKLVVYILEWWKEHEYDTTGDYGEHNVFDSEPSFVTKAKSMKEKGI